jgi:hypothetical protein
MLAFAVESLCTRPRRTNIIKAVNPRITAAPPIEPPTYSFVSVKSFRKQADKFLLRLSMKTYYCANRRIFG